MSSSLSNRSLFSRLFPPPRFLSMPAAGLSISDRAVRFITFKPGHHGLAVDAFGERAVPEGAIEAGFIKSQKDVVAALAALKREFKLEFVHATLPEEKAYLFKTDVPHMEEDEIHSSLEFKIQENVPLSPANAVFDFDIIPSEAPQTIGLSVVVLPSKVVSIYSDTLQKAGLTPLSFHTESQALARSVIKIGDLSTSIVVHFRENKTIFFIVSEGVVQFASTISLGGDALTALIQKYFKVSFEEARKMKRSNALSKTEENSELFQSLINELSVVKDEINKLSNYWHNYAPQKEAQISKVILSGEDALLPGIDRYLAIDLSGKIQVANVWTNAFSLDSYIPPIDARDSLNYAPVIGLSLP